MKMTHFTKQDGFTLPVILLISVGLMIVGLSLIQSTSSVRNSLDYQYQQRINAEAAEAGTVYANYCLSQNNLVQSWTTSKPLTQSTDCNGDAISFAPSYLLAQGTYKTSFSVGDISGSYTDGGVLIPSSSTFQQNRGNTSQVAQSFNSSLKQIVISKQFKASVSASGTSKTCAIVSNELYCWGKNSSGGSGGEDFRGQLGDGTTTDSLTPVKVIQDTGILAGKVINDVSSAQYHNCALANGKVYCWGVNTNGQLGVASPSTYSSRPVEVGGALSGKTVTAIGTSGNTSCAIAEGKIYCWGLNNRGQVGNNTSTSTYNSPQLVSTGQPGGLSSTYTATAISTSGSRSYNMCAIVDGKAYCWGANEVGQVGNNASGSDIKYPTKVYDSGVLSGKTVTAISQDGYFNGSTSYPHVCAVANSAVYCWGDNGSGQLGNNTVTDSKVPVTVRANNGSPPDALYGKTVQDVVVGLLHSCVLANGKMYCWGNNSNGQLGNGDNTQRRVPTAIKANVATDLLYNKTISAIGGGSNRGCAIADLKTYCWGRNDQGQLGNGYTSNSNVPVASSFLDPKAPVFVF